MTRLLLITTLFITALTAWRLADEPVLVGPYALQYPASFGNRFTIPADNPTTKEGIYLGRMLFCELRLSSERKLPGLEFYAAKPRSLSGHLLTPLKRVWANNVRFYA